MNKKFKLNEVFFTETFAGQDPDFKGRCPVFLERNGFSSLNKIYEYLWKPAEKKTFSILENQKKISEFVVLKTTSDSKVTSLSQAKITTENDFFVAVYLLLAEPEEGEKILGYRIPDNGKFFMFVQTTENGILWVRIEHNKSKIENRYKIFARDYDVGHACSGILLHFE
jgi:hypothetical protein